MPTPETSNDFQAIRDLQAELKARRLVLPVSMMPLKNEEATLFRFLRARKMDVSAAADMLQNTVQWRKQDRIEETMEKFLPDNKDNELRKHLPSGFLGFDKAGSPVWMEHAAAIDVPAMEAAGIGLEDFVYYHCRAMEYMIQCKYSEATEKAGHPVDSHCVILDLAGLRMNMLNSNTMKVFKAMSSVYQDHYPELMTRMFLVNIPFMFAAVWKVLQIFVDDRVKAKIRFLRKADFHTLHEFVDRDFLPESLGGKVKGKVLSDSQGFLPPSLIAVNDEVQRRIDARKAEAEHPAASQDPQPQSQQQQQQQQRQQQQSHLQQESQPESAPSTPTHHEPGLAANISISSDSLPAEMVQPPALLQASSSSASLSSAGSSPVSRLQLGSRHSAALSDTELVKLGGAHAAGPSQPSHMSQVSQVDDVRQIQPGDAVPVLLVPPQALQSAGAGVGAGAWPDEVKHKKSKRERAKDLLSSFTGGHHKQDRAAQEDMAKALQMLSEMRRTESTPNVEAEALKRNKGGGGPWMSFTRQQRPHKPRSKKGSAAARRGSPLATVTSGSVDVQPRALPDAAGDAANVVRADVGNAAELDQGSRHRHGSKWKPFCIGAPMVHDDSDVEQHLGAQNGKHPKVVMFQTEDLPATGPPGTLTQRLAHKLSAIPAYLKTSEDGDSLRLASPEGSNFSLAGSSGSYSSLQGEVVGRFASAPVLIPLASGGQAAVLASAAGTGDDRRTFTASTSSKAGPPPPDSHSQPKRAVSFTNAPQLGMSGNVGGSQRSSGGIAVSSQQRQHAQQNESVLTAKQGYRTVLQRRVKHTARYFNRNWLFLLVATINIAAIMLILNHTAAAYQVHHD